MRSFLQSFFRPMRTEARQYPDLGYPLLPVPRMAVLGLKVQPEPGIHCLLNWTPSDLARVRPLALAARFRDYERVARWMRQGALALPELQFPLLVLSGQRVGALTVAQHDALWAWFGLPCFEQIRGVDGGLLAQECEARDGFHLVGHASPEDVGGSLVCEACECGQASARVRIGPAQIHAAARK